MAHMSDYLENELLDHALGTGSWTTPSGVYAALHTAVAATVGEDGVGNESTETTTNNRPSCGAFSAAAGGVTDNDAAITWTNVAATEEYFSISLWDNATHGAGNCLFIGDLTSSVSVTAGDDFEIPAGSLSVTFT